MIAIMVHIGTYGCTPYPKCIQLVQLLGTCLKNCFHFKEVPCGTSSPSVFFFQGVRRAHCRGQKEASYKKRQWQLM